MKTKFYEVKMSFLVEAQDKETARNMVVEHNFVKVTLESNWHNFEVQKVEQVKESELV
jgi:hypothetical protein